MEGEKGSHGEGALWGCGVSFFPQPNRAPLPIAPAHSLLGADAHTPSLQKQRANKPAHKQVLSNKENHQQLLHTM